MRTMARAERVMSPNRGFFARASKSRKSRTTKGMSRDFDVVATSGFVTSYQVIPIAVSTSGQRDAFRRMRGSTMIPIQVEVMLWSRGEEPRPQPNGAVVVHKLVRGPFRRRPPPSNSVAWLFESGLSATILGSFDGVRMSHIDLPNEVVRLAEAQVVAGRATSIEEVVRVGVAALEREQRRYDARMASSAPRLTKVTLAPTPNPESSIGSVRNTAFRPCADPWPSTIFRSEPKPTSTASQRTPSPPGASSSAPAIWASSKPAVSSLLRIHGAAARATRFDPTCFATSKASTSSSIDCVRTAFA